MTHQLIQPDQFRRQAAPEHRHPGDACSRLPGCLFNQRAGNQTKALLFGQVGKEAFSAFSLSLSLSRTAVEVWSLSMSWLLLYCLMLSFSFKRIGLSGGSVLPACFKGDLRALPLLRAFDISGQIG